MAIILDADVIIRGERGTFDLTRWLASRPDEEFEIAAITVAELWHGVERATPAFRPARENYLTAVEAMFPIAPYTQTTAKLHARIWAELETSGQMPGFYDLIVAATAIENDAAVATFNRKHFEVIKGLQVIVPT